MKNLDMFCQDISFSSKSHSNPIASVDISVRALLFSCNHHYPLYSSPPMLPQLTPVGLKEVADIKNGVYLGKMGRLGYC